MGEGPVVLSEWSHQLSTVPEVPSVPVSRLASEVPLDQWTKTRYKRRFLAAVGLHNTVEVAPMTENDGPTLAAATEKAVAGDEEANHLVDINVATAVSEGCLNDGYYRKVFRDINEAGEIVQFGLSSHQMHFNSYVLRPNRPEELRTYTLAEALNGYREEDYRRSGELDDHMMLVVSLVPTNLEEKKLDHRGDGFFTRTMTFCLQGTTVEDNKVVTETVFRRGTAANEDAPYEERQAKRYDLEAIGMVYRHLGHQAPKTALEFLQNPILLRKRSFPNGVIDFLRLCDIASDVLQDKLGKREIGEYHELVAESARKDASLKNVCAAVKQDLLAKAGTFERPEDAIVLAWDLVRIHGASSAVDNHEIDPSVFGPHAKKRIEGARAADRTGDFVLREKLRAEAVEMATVTGCGGGSCGIEAVSLGSAQGQEMAALLDLKPGDTIVRDTERPCANCHKVGGVYYVYNDKKVNKGCIHCKTTEINDGTK